jgi:hypothetical protein
MICIDATHGYAEIQICGMTLYGARSYISRTGWSLPSGRECPLGIWGCAPLYNKDNPRITKTTPGTSRALTIGTSTLMVKALLRSLLRKRIHVALVKAQPFA